MSNAISYSRYGTHKQCPAKYAHRYVWNTPVEERPVGPAALRGLEIHKKIEDFLASHVDHLPQEAHHKSPYIRSLRERGARPEVEMCFNESWEPVVWDAIDGRTRGILDSMLVSGSVAWVDDWKTGRVYDDHVEQRGLYGLYILAAYPEVEEVHTSMVYIDHPKERMHTTTMKRLYLDAYKHEWEKKFERIENDTIFSTRPGNHCKFCEYSKANGGPCAFGPA